MVSSVLDQICSVPKAQAFGKPLTTPKPSKPALPVSVPFKREASGDVSRSLLLGSELKYSNFPNLSNLFNSIVKDQITAAQKSAAHFGLEGLMGYDALYSIDL
jgi:hypothetical protein